jgi:hypothetical protein
VLNEPVEEVMAATLPTTSDSPTRRNPLIHNHFPRSDANAASSTTGP